LRAFFVPGKEFSETRDINARVTFHVGFAYDGLRAWCCQRAEITPGRDKTETVTPVVVTPPEAERKSATDLPTSTIAQAKSVLQARSEQPARAPEELRAELRDVIDAVLITGESIQIMKLGNELARKYRGVPIHQRLGHSTLTELLQSWSGYVVEGEGAQKTVRKATS
jgi:hypothetical protein